MKQVNITRLVLYKNKKRTMELTWKQKKNNNERLMTSRCRFEARKLEITRERESAN